MLLSVVDPLFLVNTSIAEFIKTYFFDFKFNNLNKIKENGCLEVFDALEKLAILLCETDVPL